MSAWRQLSRGLRALFHRAAADRDVADEVEDYLEQARAAHMERGLSPAEALRAARMEVGGVTSVRDQVRRYGWETAVEATLADLRYAARRLRSNPGLTAVTVITLAIGIGASTAIFSVVNPILFRSLPYPHAERIVSVSDFGSDGTPLDVTFGTYRELAQRSRSFDALAVFRSWQPTLVSNDEPERLDGQRVGASYFRALGVSPTLGRDFRPSDDVVNGPRVAILGNALWHRRFAGSRDIIGRSVKLDGDDYTVIGVMPASFDNVLAPSAQIWRPLQFNTVFGPNDREWGHQLHMIGRLRDGVSLDAAQHELNAIARTPRSDFPRVPWALLGRGLATQSLQADVTSGVRPILLAVLGAVILVLIIACANVTNLLLASGARRRGEFAMRAALGARRARLTRQLLTESLLLAIVGGVLGVVVAELGVRALVSLVPAGLPRLNEIGLDSAVMLFGFAITTLIGVSVGGIPALRASQAESYRALQEVSQRTTGSHRFTREALVVAEVALAVVLLVSAGLLLRSVRDLLAVNVGFDPSHVLTMQVQEAGQRFDSDSARYNFFAEALDAVQHVPGVTAAAFTSQLPMSGDLSSYGVHFEGDVDANGGGAALEYAVTPEYFATMHIPLLSGRLLDAHDRAGSARTALINASFAKRQFPHQDPIGEHFDFGAADGQPYTIVGVVGDVKQTSLADGESDAIYITPTQWHWVENPDVAGGAHSQQRDRARPRNSSRDQIGRQKPGDSAHRDDERSGRQIGRGSPFRARSVRGLRTRRTHSRRGRHLRRALVERDGEIARARNPRSTRRITRTNPHPRTRPRNETDSARRRGRTDRSRGRHTRYSVDAVRHIPSRYHDVSVRDSTAERGCGGRVQCTSVASGEARSYAGAADGVGASGLDWRLSISAVTPTGATTTVA